MRNVILIIGLLVFVLTSCRTHKDIAPTVIERTNVETRYERIVEIDTVLVELPVQSAMRETKDSTSFLETDFATSIARIGVDGTLFHNLINKDRPLEVPVKKVTEQNDSIIYVDRVTEVPVPVERKLTKWEKWKIEWAAYLIVLVVIELVFILRKPLLSAIRKLLPKV